MSREKFSPEPVEEQHSDVDDREGVDKAQDAGPPPGKPLHRAATVEFDMESDNEHGSESNLKGWFSGASKLSM